MGDWYENLPNEVLHVEAGEERWWAEVGRRVEEARDLYLPKLLRIERAVVNAKWRAVMEAQERIAEVRAILALNESGLTFSRGNLFSGAQRPETPTPPAIDYYFELT